MNVISVFKGLWRLIELILQRSFQEAPQISENGGNSGSKFFETCDKAFIVKTIESEEVEMMHNLLPKYHQVSYIFPNAT